ncbi:MAG: DUF2098 domain-containing protein [Methanomassiliicoccus sp.]|nr:DUF2098 domain-containing protein [Methanomassiliicoccus sp.]
MIVGDIVRYRNTGTVGKVEDIKVDGQVTWALLDTSKLYYDATSLDPASPDDYREIIDREAGGKDQLEDIMRLRQEMEEMAEKVSRITPSGAG